MRKINNLVVHCSATSPDMDIGREEIYKWHRQRGMMDVGYHYIIRRNGTLEKGRDDETIGAHVMGHNRDSLGICMVGGIDAKGKSEDNFTLDQYVTLASVIQVLKVQHPDADILGHRDFPDVAKDCPCFDVRKWYKETVENTVSSNPISKEAQPRLLKS